MSFNPNPITMALVSEQRQADLHAEVDRLRRARRAAGADGAARRQPRFDRYAMVALLLLLALLWMASTTVAQAPPPSLPVDTIAVQKVREATA